MKYFVEYNDDYAYYNDGVSLEQFDKIEEALDFIQKRMAHDSSRKLSNYTLFKCEIIQIKAVEVVTKIEAEHL